MLINKKDFKKLKNADPDLFEKLYLFTKDVTYNYILIKTNNNTELTNDILRTTYHSALRSINKLKNHDNLLEWIIRIATIHLNKHIN